MISDRALVALRGGAAVVHAVAGLRLRVHDGGQLLIEVSHEATAADGAVAMTPCQFRRAVVSAHQHRRQGRQLVFMGMEGGGDPSVSYGVRPSTDRVLPGGILRVRHHERWLHVLALGGDVDQLDDLVAEPYDGNGFEVGIAVHHDLDLGVGLLHVSTDIGDGERSAAAVDALVSAAARQAITEFEAHLTPSTTPAPTPASTTGDAATEGVRAPDRAARDPRRR